jgi:hypothetical protein
MQSKICIIDKKSRLTEKTLQCLHGRGERGAYPVDERFQRSCWQRMKVAVPATCGIPLWRSFCRRLRTHRSPLPLRPPISAAPLVDLRRQSGSEVWESGRDLDRIVPLGPRGRGGAAGHGCRTGSIRVIILSCQSE